MKQLDTNMTLTDCLKHFNVCDLDVIGVYLVAHDLEHAKWLECIEPCVYNGQQVEKDDLLLLDKITGTPAGVFKPFKPVSTQNNKQEH